MIGCCHSVTPDHKGYNATTRSIFFFHQSQTFCMYFSSTPSQWNTVSFSIHYLWTKVRKCLEIFCKFSKYWKISQFSLQGFCNKRNSLKVLEYSVLLWPRLLQITVKYSMIFCIAQFRLEKLVNFAVFWKFSECFWTFSNFCSQEMCKEADCFSVWRYAL